MSASAPETGTAPAPWRARLQALVTSRPVQRLVITLIVLNAVVLGMETSSALTGRVGGLLSAADRIILGVFVLELALRIAAFGVRFFRDPWGLFDFFVVGVALVPASESLSVLRALRVLRVLRLVSTVPRMRRVVEALLASLPGIGAVGALLGLVFYVAAVIATRLFGESFPEWFGGLGRSLYTLFQIMTLESWSMGIVRPVMAEFPYAWLFFVLFILVATFTMLNLFIAIVVNAMQSAHAEEHAEERAADLAHGRAMLEEMHALRAELGALREQLAAAQGPAGRRPER